jgi:hypothetical protein
MTHFITTEDLPNLKKEYEIALEEKAESFIYHREGEDIPLNTDYARYLIEYMETIKKRITK